MRSGDGGKAGRHLPTCPRRAAMNLLPPYAEYLGIRTQRAEDGELQFVMPFADVVLGRPGYLRGGAAQRAVEARPALIVIASEAKQSRTGLPRRCRGAAVYPERRRRRRRRAPRNDGIQPPALIVSRAMTSCWIWLVPS